MATILSPINLAGTAPTLLETIQAFSREYALPVPAVVGGSNDAGVLQLQEIYQSVGDDLITRTDWEFSRTTASWVAPGGRLQGRLTDLLPLRPLALVSDTFWDVTSQERIEGPLSPDVWQSHLVLNSAVVPKFMIAEGNIEVFPDRPAGHVMSLRYKSASWVVDEQGARKARATADTDRPLFPHNLIKLGMIFWWKRIKEMPYGVEQLRYEAAVEDLGSSNMVRPVLHMDGAFQPSQPGVVVPVRNWPVT